MERKQSHRIIQVIINLMFLPISLFYNCTLKFEIEKSVISGGSKGGTLGVHPPTDQNFLNFMQFLGKIWHICMLAPPPGRMAPPPTGNPRSTPGNLVIL